MIVLVARGVLACEDKFGPMTATPYWPYGSFTSH
jgi:hypothetical protein